MPASTAAPGIEEGVRAYARTDATPTWEALETAVGQVEGGHAVAFSSGMAAVAAVLDLLPAGGRIVAPNDCYFGVGELLADGQQQGRWAIDRVDLTDTAERPSRRRRRGPALAGDPLESAA